METGWSKRINVVQVMDLVKFRYWSWFVAQMKGFSFPFYEWSTDPKLSVKAL